MAFLRSISASSWALVLVVSSAGCGEAAPAQNAQSVTAGMAALPQGGFSAITGGVGGALPVAGATGGSAPIGGAGAVAGTDMNAAAGTGTGGVGGIVMMTGGVGGEAAASGTTATGGSGGTAGSNPDEPVANCTGKPGGSGNVTRTWNGLAQYITHYPPGLDPNTPATLVFVAHGFTMSGAVMQSITRFDAVADREKFVVVYPNGDGGAFPWDVGVGACAPGGAISAGAAESLHGYLDGMREAVEADQCINPNHIFVTGFSMGGYFSHHVGCQRGNEFARAVGPHSGGTYPGECPGAPVPNFIMHGAADTFIDHNLCGKGARDMWLPRNSCMNTFETRMVTGGSCEWYDGCDPNGQTVYCEFAGVAHGWAPGATEAVWEFFKSYR